MNRIGEKMRKGKCAICGQIRELSYEHIPPKAAFNAFPVKKIKGEEFVKGLFDDDGLSYKQEHIKYVNQQRGSGDYTLCVECNNNTGAWYGDEYVKIAYRIKEFFETEFVCGQDTVVLNEIFPMRFVKQIIALFCSVCNCEDSRIQFLREFVLDKEQKGLPMEKCSLHMYFTFSPLSRQCGIGDQGYGEEGEDLKTILFSEIVSRPFGFVLYLDPKDDAPYIGFDITSLSNYDYYDLCDVAFPILFYDINSVFPLQYKRIF